MENNESFASPKEVCELKDWDGRDETNLCKCGEGDGTCKRNGGTETPAFCEGEKCSVCGNPANHKVGEEEVSGHNLTAYVCQDHFEMVFMPYKRTPASKEKPDFEAKVNFYREQTEKLREYLEVNRIGRANQTLFEALYDHVKEQREKIQSLKQEIERLRSDISESQWESFERLKN